MLNKSKKKRTDGKDESCPQDSNQIYFAVPGNDAVEVGEMATTDHGGTSGGLHDDGQRPDNLQVAWLLREKLSDLLDGDKGEFPELGLRSLLDMAASRNIVSVDPKMLNPVLWRTLPKELLLLVFAYLPVPDIIRLRSLSREWRRDMATVNSGINKACDEASSTMVAGFSRLHIMCEGFPFPEFLVTICTQSSQYSYRLEPGNFVPGENLWDDTGAHDAGLVCFVSTWKPSKAKPLCIVVVNLLSRVQRKLPPLQYAYLTPPKMMHIEVDSETKCYRVVVVGKNMKGRPRVEIYHSGEGQWTKVTPPLGFIFGVAHKWLYFKRYWSFISTKLIPSVYDSNSRVLMTFPSDDRSRLMRDLKLMTFWKDCKFVLDMNFSGGRSLHHQVSYAN